MADISELEDLIARRREERHVEYKESQRWDELKDKIAKTALGMANLRDGGYIVLGMRRNSDHTYAAAGVSREDAATFTEDSVRAYVNSYANPYVALQVSTVELETKRFTVVSVDQFHDVPVICRKGGVGLRPGAIYYRSRRMPETTEIRDASDMRELLDLATERAVARFVRVFSQFGGTQGLPGVASSSEQRYVEELRGL
ncbi:MAG: ATP-binding protein [Chloroflexi bacterium]|nr:ATP-binding protein [Chloroflexota bacterium]